MKNLKVAIVHDFIQSLGGAERVTLALSEIYPDAPIYTLTYNPKLGKYFRGKKIITSYLQRWQFIPNRFFIGMFPIAIESFDFTGFDVVISSSNSFAKNILTKPETLHISYIHSPMRYAWDVAHTQLENQAHRTPLGNVFGLVQLIAGRIIHQLRIWDNLGSSRVDIFVANSINVRNRIRKYYRRDARVIYPPVDVENIHLSKNNEGYYLAISRLSKYKRVDLAIEACRDLDLPLKVIGTGEEEKNYKKMAGEKTEILGWISDKEKAKYIENCKALIFPGEEDFGIVPVEAMAAGKPVIAFKKGGLLETVVEGKTGIFFDEQTVGSLKRAIRILDNKKDFDISEIRKQAEKFSAKKFRENIINLVKEVSEKYGKTTTKS